MCNRSKNEFCIYQNGEFHDEDGLMLILMFLIVFSMHILGFYNGTQEMEKKAIDRAKGPKYHSFALLSSRGQSAFLELFLPLWSSRVPEIHAERSR